MKYAVLGLFLTLILSGCDQMTQSQKQQPNTEQPPSVPAPQTSAHVDEKRFAFPAKSAPFAESSVALDTTGGRLCKTYAWQDTVSLPRGLPLCSDLTTLPQSSVLAGAAKAYMGFTYMFNGTKWVKGNKAQKYNPNTKDMDPWSDDQYDPLNLFSKEEKAKRALTTAEIQRVADQFGVSYAEAMEEAKQQGYQVSPKH